MLSSTGKGEHAQRFLAVFAMTLAEADLPPCMSTRCGMYTHTLRAPHWNVAGATRSIAHMQDAGAISARFALQTAVTALRVEMILFTSTSTRVQLQRGYGAHSVGSVSLH